MAYHERRGEAALEYGGLTPLSAFTLIGVDEPQ